MQEDLVLDRQNRPQTTAGGAARRRHVVRLTGSDALSVLRALTDLIEPHEADLVSLSVRTIEDRVEASFHLLGGGEADARLLCDRLAARTCVQSVGVEHHWGKS